MIELCARGPETFETERTHTDTAPRTGVTERKGVPLVEASHLIVLKTLAWSNLRENKAAGERIDSNQIEKHRNDIFRLFPVLNPGQTIPISR